MRMNILSKVSSACSSTKANEPPTLTKADLRKFFSNLPDEGERSYENKIVAYVMQIGKEATNDLQDILKCLITDCDDKVSFAAFVALCSIYRRNKNHSAHQKLISACEHKFNRHRLFSHFKLLLYVDNNFDYDKKDEILKEAKANAETYNKHAGILHAFSDLVATAFEHANFINAQPPDDHWIEDGLKAIEQAIILNNDYAKFYSTKARLLALKGEYTQVPQLIGKAIDLEKSEENDYALRINGYLNHLQRIQTQKTYQDLHQQTQELAQKVQETTDKLNNSTTKNLESLALFAAITSFTIGSIGIASVAMQTSFFAAACLILVLMGALLCVFACIGIVLHRSEKHHDNFLVFGLGIALVIIVILLFYFLSTKGYFSSANQILSLIHL